MQRIRHNYQFNLIRDAIGLLPVKVKPYLEVVNFVIDYNPYWVGFNPPKETGDGRQYCQTCHCVDSHYAPDKKITIFLFSENIKLYNNPFNVIWHELAHAIHEQLDHYNNNWIPITDYEKQDKWGYETFACSFVRWLYRDRELDDWGGNQELQREYDKRPIEFFDKLLMKVG